MPKRVTTIVYRYIQESMYSTGYSWIDRAADNAYPRRIESLRRYSARKLFLLDRKIEQIGTVEDIFFYFFTTSISIVLSRPCEL